VLKKLCEKNSQDVCRKQLAEKILTYPFILIKQESAASFVIDRNNNNNHHKLSIISDKQLEIMDSDNICKSLIKNE